MPRIQAVRPGSAAMPEPLPAPDNGRAGSADSGRTAGRASQGQPSRRRSRRHRGPQATPGRGERQDKRADSRAGRRNQPQRDRRTREPKSYSKHKKQSTTVYQNEKGREARTGRDTRHGWPSLAGALAGKAPARGRLAALRGACLGLAGRGNGRHSRPQAAFPRAPPRANARGGGACAANARGGLNCGPRTARAEQAA